MDGRSNRDGVGVAERIAVAVFRMISGNGRGVFSPRSMSIPTSLSPMASRPSLSQTIQPRMVWNSRLLRRGWGDERGVEEEMEENVVVGELRR